MDKTAAIFTNKMKTGRLILSNIKSSSELYELIEDFIGDPTIEKAVELEDKFNKISSNLELIRSSINAIAKISVLDSEEIQDEDTDDEIGVDLDENGVRLI
jgi:hypothetical protein